MPRPLELIIAMASFILLGAASGSIAILVMCGGLNRTPKTIGGEGDGAVGARFDTHGISSGSDFGTSAE